MVKANVTLIIVITGMIALSCERHTSGIQPLTSPSPLELTLSLPHSSLGKSIAPSSAVSFAQKVKEYSNGAITIGFVFSGNNAITALLTQKTDGAVVSTAELATISPEFGLFDIPYLIPDQSTAEKIVNGAIGKLLFQKMAQEKLVGLAFWSLGFKQFASTRSISNADELSRFALLPTEKSTLLQQLHSNPIAPPEHDRNSVPLLNRNELIVETSFKSLPDNSDLKHILLTKHLYEAQVLTFSKRVIETLNSTQKQILLDAALDVANQTQTSITEETQSFLLSSAQNGIETSAPSPPIQSYLLTESRKILEKNRLSVGPSIIERIQALSPTAIPHESNDLVIALDADLIGNSAMSGLAIKRGIEIAVDEINASGGLMGKSLTVISRDNSMIPARGLDNLRHFADIPNLIAVFGGISSPVILSELDFIHTNKILFLVPWAAATSIIDNGYTPNYVFRISVRDQYAAGYLLDDALKKTDKVGLLLVNNPWGRGNYESLSETLSKKALKPTAVEWFDWGEIHFDKKVRNLVNKGTKVVIFIGNPVEGTKFVKSLAAIDSPPSVISHWGITGSVFAEMAHPHIQQIDLKVLQTFSFLDTNREKAKQLAKNYHAKYFTKQHTDIVAPTGTAHAYDLTMLLSKAVKTANSTDMQYIRQALENIPYHDGVVKLYSPPFSPLNHDALSQQDFILSRYIDGVLHPVSTHD